MKHAVDGDVFGVQWYFPDHDQHSCSDISLAGSLSFMPSSCCPDIQNNPQNKAVDHSLWLYSSLR